MTDAGEVAADIGLEYVVHLLGHDLQAHRLPPAQAADPRPWESPMGAFRFCLVLWVFQPAGPVVRDRRRLEAVRKFLQPAASTRSQTARCSPRRCRWPRAGSSCPTFPLGI